MLNHAELRNTRNNFNAKRLNDRDTAELMGICRGVLADGILTTTEIVFIIKWLESKPDLLIQWPSDELYIHLGTAMNNYEFNHGVLNGDEEKFLLDFLCGLTGMGQQEDDTKATIILPFSNPMPDIEFEGNGFCFSGKFSCQSRKQCETEVKNRNGFTRKDPSQNIRYLIVGGESSPAWTQTSYGRKIEKAVALQRSGHTIDIITEAHWIHYIQ